MSEKELDEFYGRAFDSKNMKIIKLRAENEQLRTNLEHKHYEIVDLSAEVERLRADNARMLRKLTIIHDISQNTIEPCYQALQNIAATAGIELVRNALNVESEEQSVSIPGTFPADFT